MSGRTDAGVHAHHQVCHFDADEILPVERLPYILNRILNSDLRVISAKTVDKDFHARFKAIQRKYVYLLTNRNDFTTTILPCIAFVPFKLINNKFNEISNLFCGEHDFVNFRSKGSNEKSTVRTITHFKIVLQDIVDPHTMEKFNCVRFEINGNSFLYHMVRNIVGASLSVFSDKHKINDLKEMIENTGKFNYTTAPASGLSLTQVVY